MLFLFLGTFVLYTAISTFGLMTIHRTSGYFALFDLSLRLTNYFFERNGLWFTFKLNLLRFKICARLTGTTIFC